MLLQIPEITNKLMEYGLLGMAVITLGYVIYKLYGRNMTLVEKTLKMYDEERENSRETESEYKDYLKETVKSLAVVLERNSRVIEEYTITHKHLLDLIDEHMVCGYNPAIKRSKGEII